jgi:FMN-dependent NADH-azoreductase
VITQPGLTFRYVPARGYLPLLDDGPTIVILASGSDFVTGINRGRIDMATPYLREAPRFIGVNNLRFVPIRPTSGSEPRVQVRIAGRRILTVITTMNWPTPRGKSAAGTILCRPHPCERA